LMHGWKRVLTEYAIAVALVGLATLARWSLDFILGDRATFICYIVAVAIASWLGGARPGLLATGLGGLAGNFFFIQPRGTFGLAKDENALGLVLYAVTTLILVGLAESQRRARSRAESSARIAIHGQALLEEGREPLLPPGE
jgi:K+-sensing histidine kinase KdpD